MDERARDEEHLRNLTATATVLGDRERFWSLVAAAPTVDEAVVALRASYGFDETQAAVVLATQARRFVASEVRKVRQALGEQPETAPDPTVEPASDEPHEVASSRVHDARGDVPPEPPHLSPDRVGDLVRYARAQAAWVRNERRKARARDLASPGLDEAIATWDTVALALAETYDLVDLLPGEEEDRDEGRGSEGR
ncbi:hypothetical protein ACOACO_07970 [Nocardioides sp. CPCC 205120]|uniref:hypothetical protein n=1 Tax=Nocardioides sp. CPCC 205120 TaxID=3406462 RepID=UPI003B50BCBF